MITLPARRTDSISFAKARGIFEFARGTYHRQHDLLVAEPYVDTQLVARATLFASLERRITPKSPITGIGMMVRTLRYVVTTVIEDTAPGQRPYYRDNQRRQPSAHYPTTSFAFGNPA